MIRGYCHRETITLFNRTYAVYDKPQSRSAGTWFPYLAYADPRAEPPTHVSEYIVRSEYPLVGSIREVRAPHFLHSHCSPTFSGLSTGIFRHAPYVLNETKRPSPSRFGKRPNKRPLLSKRRLISSTQQATLAFRSKASLLACRACRIHPSDTS